MIIRNIQLTLLLIMLSTAALAAPPENADPALAPWFQGLKQPGTGTSCCSIADCRPVDYRMTPAGYEVRAGEEWLPVPEERVLKNHANPVGRGVVCRSSTGVILCFVPAGET